MVQSTYFTVGRTLDEYSDLCKDVYQQRSSIFTISVPCRLVNIEAATLNVCNIRRIPCVRCCSWWLKQNINMKAIISKTIILLPQSISPLDGCTSMDLQPQLTQNSTRLCKISHETTGVYGCSLSWWNILEKKDAKQRIARKHEEDNWLISVEIVKATYKCILMAFDKAFISFK